MTYKEAGELIRQHHDEIKAIHPFKVGGQNAAFVGLLMMPSDFTDDEIQVLFRTFETNPFGLEYMADNNLMSRDLLVYGIYRQGGDTCKMLLDGFLNAINRQ